MTFRSLLQLFIVFHFTMLSLMRALIFDDSYAMWASLNSFVVSHEPMNFEGHLTDA